MHPVEKTDLWRLLKMCHEGGLYMDIDRLSNQPISEYINSNTDEGSENGNATKMILPLYHGSIDDHDGECKWRNAHGP